jgi:hypothetical protein
MEEGTATAHEQQEAASCATLRAGLDDDGRVV